MMIACFSNLVVALDRINLLESVLSEKFGVDSRVQSGKGTLNLEAKKVA